jgi:hypothetical protein
VRRPPRLWFLDPGDFFPPDLDEFLATLTDVLTEDDLYLTAIAPQTARVHFAGRARIWCPEACEISLSKPAWIVRARKDIPTEPVNRFRMRRKAVYYVCRTKPIRVTGQEVFVVARRPVTVELTALGNGELAAAADCTVEFSEPVTAVAADDGTQAGPGFKLRMAGGRRYRIRLDTP